MKRNEMVSEIYKIMKQFEDCEITKKEASTVLKKIEKLGMLPPLTPLTMVYKRKTYLFYDRSWEKVTKGKK